MRISGGSLGENESEFPKDCQRKVREESLRFYYFAP